LKIGLLRRLSYLIRIDRSDRISLTRLTAIFTGGNIISLVLSLMAGLLVARFSNPEDLGVFNSITLILGYVIFLQAGVLNGLNRELPYFIGRGLQEEAELYGAAAQAWAILIGGLVGFSMLITSGWFIFHGNRQYAAGFAVMAFASFTLFYVTYYLQITYRTKGDFVQLSGINIIKNITSLASSILVMFLGYYGLCIRLLLVEGINFILHWQGRPLRVKPRWDKQRLKGLFKIGAPIFVTGQLYAWWWILNSTLVLFYFHSYGLGIFQLAVITATTIEILFISMGQVLYPRMAETYGKKEDIGELVTLARRPLGYLALVTIPLIIIGWLLLPIVVPIILPKYSEAIPAAQWMLLAAAPLSLHPLNNLFAVVKRMDLYFISLVAGMSVYYLVLIVLLNQEMTLVVFPQALFVGRVVMIGFSLIFVFFLKQKKPIS
jgi:O-antigen/teichoic acid export membrane protein